MSRLDGPLPLGLFDFGIELAPRQVAQEPVRPRDASRLLHLDRRTGATSHHGFRELPKLLRAGDLLVANRTRVLPARLKLRRDTGGAVELLLVRPTDGADPGTARRWSALGKPGRGLKPGTALVGPDGVQLRIAAKDGPLVEVEADAPLLALWERHGEMPLPPYIERDTPRAVDVDDYQTVFAALPGSVAAPTAGLHFTERVLDELRQAGVELATVTLHVGPGTFLPVRPEHAGDVRAHRMHPEWYEVPAATAGACTAARARGGRVIAVGTTTVRALESSASSGRAAGDTEAFITPGYEFLAVDGMLTNFHQPRSTLLMLVCAFAGREAVAAAYAQASARGYRFYSYGDAMLIL